VIALVLSRATARDSGDEEVARRGFSAPLFPADSDKVGGADETIAMIE
jgi:hypothetical protein